MTTSDPAKKPTFSRQPSRFPRFMAVVGGVFFLAFGVWAMVSPETFFDAVATFEPYNQHLVQDLGAFQIGIGTVLVIAAVPARADALAVALFGAGIGSGAHTVSHLVGRDLGGTPAVDIPLFSVLTVLLLAAGVVRWRQE